ncbi:hypothetical protein [Blastococcus saxobsidens]|uniref:Uncharacterized protein n=1 Tax=Blastococcus saxobsidens (strain DD2) TaxID=1146883 RepID=H6RJE4_BLASD|nr:hypothetical protein [Blastococcus saxobsidens]CCG01057.1 protein of unknown function [Blastococcus saxobsidens DD2]
MNDLALLREAGPEAPPLSAAARRSARASLLAEIEGPASRRSRVPSRKVSFRLGLAAVTAAAAWAAAVVIAAPDGPGTPADSVTLVDFQTPTFPLSLDPAPAGMAPGFSGDGESAGFAEYDSADGDDRFTVGIHEDEPDWLEDAYAHVDVSGRDEVTVDGVAADLVRGVRELYCEDGLTVCERERFAELVWERAEDQWVVMSGEGRYSRTSELVAVAESLVDRPQRATLTAELAPAGWSVQFFKMGRVLTLVNDAYEQQTVTVHVPLPEDVPPLEQVRENLMGPVGPQLDVTVQGRPAALVRVDSGPRDRGWYLQGQFEDGTTFTLQVPDAFTQEQVVEFAEQVTYHP